ncbi:hypothetical protein [Zavarzinella formosa]|uniref:hypothetical protein n=1 Tax=Zavarzinella formosa TaxID=360055 RepID=UPI00035CD934|nr:hypothetical protein [Zavarzinella formosa]
MTMNSDRRRFEQALSSSEPSAALSVLAVELKIEGMGQAAMYRLFAEHQQTMNSNDPCYDAILDQMNLIWGGGWAKGRALFEKELTEADLANFLE